MSSAHTSSLNIEDGRSLTDEDRIVTDLQDSRAERLLERYAAKTDSNYYINNSDFRYFITEEDSQPVIYEISVLDSGTSVTYSARKTEMGEGLIEKEVIEEDSEIVKEWFEQLDSYSNSSS